MHLTFTGSNGAGYSPDASLARRYDLAGTAACHTGTAELTSAFAAHEGRSDYRWPTRLPGHDVGVGYLGLGTNCRYRHECPWLDRDDPGHRVHDTGRLRAHGSNVLQLAARLRR